MQEEDDDDDDDDDDGDDDVELNVLGCRLTCNRQTVTNAYISMVQCCFTCTETVRLIRTGAWTATSTFTQLLNSGRLTLLVLGYFLANCCVTTFWLSGRMPLVACV